MFIKIKQKLKCKVMKTRMLSLSMLMVLGLGAVSAQTLKTEKIDVAGNCGMCEQSIEEAAKSVEGINSAEWNQEMDMLEVIYDSSQVKSRTVHKAVAKAGYDTKMFQAKDKDYEELPECCRYERMSEELYKKERIIKIARVRGTIDWRP